jgi:REP element-mobilizing transposase RayT
VLPEHLHCLWRLPPGDDDFPTRWRLIKSRFSRAVAATERRSRSRRHQGERGLWQRRYWEHLVRDDVDYRHHLDYIHFNPVKHGLSATRTTGRIHHWTNGLREERMRGIGGDRRSPRKARSPRDVALATA